ncbi:MAG TPA: tRNA pseudouridine(13) synthase TruD [Thermoplasmatales archaeon]|nr:tRNA pseudouridine(13) synthase TruD [Thermoplasmatales archaeon]HEX08572.1 tRNA pseudouridine(13) synthase TruD [Thermoplasmatales archaeon]
MSSSINPPLEERIVGIECFYTADIPGIEGKLRTLPEDFIVIEKPLLPDRDDNGLYSIIEITSRNWETNLLLKDLSKKLHISRKKINFAGTKDKRALKTQYMSIKAPPEDILKLDINDVKIKFLYKSNKPIKIGDLTGNKFDIKVRNINLEKNELIGRLEKIGSIIKGIRGFPNFFGIQRFGIIRPVTHLVGKSIIEGDFKEAVKHYIAHPTEHEKEPERKARAFFHETEDFKEAIKLYPDHLHFEKAILNKLIESNGDYIEALKILPFNLLTMFVYAYQSYIFNRILSERIRKGLPIDKAVEGDIIMPFSKNMFRENELIPVTRRNIEKVNREIAKGKAYVTGLLVGYDPVFAEGEMGEIEHRIIEEEKIDTRNFIIPEIPFLSSSGSRRSLLAPLDNLEWKINKDEINEGKLQVDFKFELIKGSYATSLLREFMKSNDITNY